VLITLVKCSPAASTLLSSAVNGCWKSFDLLDGRWLLEFIQLPFNIRPDGVTVGAVGRTVLIIHSRSQAALGRYQLSSFLTEILYSQNIDISQVRLPC